MRDPFLVREGERLRDRIEKANGRRWVTIGNDQVNAIYENDRWRLCDSDFFGTATVNGQPTLRRFKK